MNLGGNTWDFMPSSYLVNIGRRLFYLFQGGEVMIELQNITINFNSKKENIHAVKDVSLTINDGEIFGIIGFSGAGKSTLVRCINLLERPSSGKVILDGKDLTEMSDKELREERKKIGMIFQHFNLMRSRTVYGNIAFPLKKRGLSKEEKDKKITSLLRLVGLEDKKDAYPSQLSGGQKQRVAIARALANDPKVLLCDEATSALDPQTTKAILKLLEEVNKQLGITIIIITHQMEVVKDICDRVAIMDMGEVVETGHTADVFLKPKETVTKSFIETASNISKVYDLIKSGDAFTELKPGEKMMILTYSNVNTKEAMISHLSRTYGVDASIIFGNVEILKDKPLGKLVVIMGGKEENIGSAIDYLKSAGIDVEVIKE